VIKGKYFVIRNLCANCGIKPQAINYKKADRIYYRSLCESCITLQNKKRKPRWQKENYIKNNKCECCGFLPKFMEQLTVHDDRKSFKTVCLNCHKEIAMREKLESKNLIVKADF
jgi:hypothetical protein